MEKEENKSLYYILIIGHKSIYGKLNDCYTLWISNLVNSIMSLRASYTHYEFSFQIVRRRFFSLSFYHSVSYIAACYIYDYILYWLMMLLFAFVFTDNHDDDGDVVVIVIRGVCYLYFYVYRLLLLCNKKENLLSHFFLYYIILEIFFLFSSLLFFFFLYHNADSISWW